MFGEKKFTGVGYPTPVSIPEDTTCLTLQIPASDEWWALVVGVLWTLTLEWNWQQFETGIERDAAATRWTQMLQDALDVAATENICPTYTVGTPYWDDATDLDDQADAADQPWYGHVEGDTFIEDAAKFVIAGFLAKAVSPQAAVLYHTFERKFRLAWMTGGQAGFAQVFIDTLLAGEFDLSGDAGVIVEQPFVVDELEDGHDILVVWQPSE